MLTYRRHQKAGIRTRYSNGNILLKNGYSYTNLVSHGSVKPLCVEKRFDDRVEGLAVFAEEIVMKLKCYSNFVYSLNPAWIGSVDRNAV